MVLWVSCSWAGADPHRQSSKGLRGHHSPVCRYPRPGSGLKYWWGVTHSWLLGMQRPSGTHLSPWSAASKLLHASTRASVPCEASSPERALDLPWTTGVAEVTGCPFPGYKKTGCGPALPLPTRSSGSRLPSRLLPTGEATEEGTVVPGQQPARTGTNS